MLKTLTQCFSRKIFGQLKGFIIESACSVDSIYMRTYFTDIAVYGFIKELLALKLFRIILIRAEYDFLIVAQSEQPCFFPSIA